MTNNVSNYTGLSSGQYVNINGLLSNVLYNDNSLLSRKITQQTAINSNISNLGKVKSSFSALQDAFNAVSDSLKKFTTSALPAGLTLEPTSSGTHNIGVSQLATSQINSFKQGFNQGALGFNGTLDLNSGTNSNGNFIQNKTTSINISNSDTLQDIATKINSANPGFNANIINANGKQYLALSSSTGASNAFEVVANDVGNTGLSALNLVNGGTNYNAVSVAQDAIATVSGVEISSSNNTFNNIPGLNFTATQTFTKQEIKVSQDLPAIKEALQKFAKQYNTTKADLANSGIKDMTLNSFDNNLRKTFNAVSNNDYANNLNNFGLSFDKAGLMSFDASKVSSSSSSAIFNQFTNNDAAKNLFSNTIVAGKIDSLNTLYTSQNKNLSNEINNLKNLISKKQTFYQGQYALLDNNLSNINNSLANVTAMMQQFTTKTV